MSFPDLQRAITLQCYANGFKSHTISLKTIITDYGKDGSPGDKLICFKEYACKIAGFGSFKANNESELYRVICAKINKNRGMSI